MLSGVPILHTVTQSGERNVGFSQVSPCFQNITRSCGMKFFFTRKGDAGSRTCYRTGVVSDGVFMQVIETGLPGVLLLQPRRFGDDRGFFCESWNRQTMASAGLDIDFVQDNMSLSADTGTLRGMHYQAPPHAQAKLVSCVRGQIYDAVLDVRRGSPTFGQSFGVDLSFKNGLQLFVPEGFLHGFITREPNTIVTYKVNRHYDGASDGSVRWDTCGIDWGMDGDPILSEKDANAAPLGQFDSPFEWSAS